MYFTLHMYVLYCTLSLSAHRKPISFSLPFFFFPISSFTFFWGQEHCKHHFLDEEKNLLPWLEAVELNKEQQDKMLEQLLDVMKQTHSHLLNFFLEGLLPLEALQYLDLITNSSDKIRTSLGSMLLMNVK